ncbi:reticulon-2-like [Elgaria multicarinata webbii]|uniref:reticulon-2-like n=1 Tax=Elgaria multicarinata webbii TaxID=159646 RepID=UPI002FCCE6EB
MGQVLGFAHCKESPSTASTTPDSTDGGNDESDFPELQTAREFSEDEEEEASVEWGTPRELTFSYITIAAPLSGSPTLGEHGPRSRRDSQTRRARGPLPRTETCETFVPALGDSLENIPSLCPSPDGEGASPPGDCQGLDPFSGWDVRAACSHELDVAEGKGVQGSPRHSPVEQGTEWGRSSSSSSSEVCSDPADSSLEGLLPPDALAPQPGMGAPCGADIVQPQALTSPEFRRLSLRHEEMEEDHEEEGAGQEPATEQHQVEPDQSGNTLEICITAEDGGQERLLHKVPAHRHHRRLVLPLPTRGPGLAKPSLAARPRQDGGSYDGRRQLGFVSY